MGKKGRGGGEVTIQRVSILSAKSFENKDRAALETAPATTVSFDFEDRNSCRWLCPLTPGEKRNNQDTVDTHAPKETNH